MTPIEGIKSLQMADLDEMPTIDVKGPRIAGPARAVDDQGSAHRRCHFGRCTPMCFEARRLLTPVS
jgi:hypothetical protein